MLLKRPGDVQGPSTIFKIQNYKLLIGAKQHSRFKILYSRSMKNNTKFLIPDAKQKSRFRTLEVENQSCEFTKCQSLSTILEKDLQNKSLQLGNIF